MRYYPRELCPKCWSSDVEWFPISGNGELYSWSIVRIAPTPALKDKVPFVVCLIDLEEGVRVFSRLVEVEHEQVEIGMPLAISYEKVTDDVTLPLFKPATVGGAK